MSDTRDTYLEKIKAQLDEWNADIDRLEAKARQAEAGAKIQYQSQVEALKKKRKDTAEKFEKIRQAGGDAWKDMKAGLDLAVDAFGEALRSAKSRFL